MNEFRRNGKRFEVLAKVFQKLKEDKPVTISPCSMKLICATNKGVEEIDGFEDLDLQGKMIVIRSVLEMHEDVFNKYKEREVRNSAPTARAAKAGMQALAEAQEVVKEADAKGAEKEEKPPLKIVPKKGVDDADPE